MWANGECLCVALTPTKLSRNLGWTATPDGPDLHFLRGLYGAKDVISCAAASGQPYVYGLTTSHIATNPC